MLRRLLARRLANLSDRNGRIVRPRLLRAAFRLYGAK